MSSEIIIPLKPIFFLIISSIIFFECVAVKYGSTPEKQFWYVCPQYWCLTENRPLTKKDMEDAKKSKMLKETVEGADLAFEIGSQIKKDFSIQNLPLMISMINTICEDAPLKINWKDFK